MERRPIGVTRTSNEQRRHPEIVSGPFESYAWQVHDGLHEWTAKVDAKASVILTIETAILGMIVVFAGQDHRLDRMTGWETWDFRAGVALLVGAIILAGAAVFPQLNRRDVRRAWRHNYVYFGHLRRWEPQELVNAVESGGAAQTKLVLGTQLIAISKIVWRKHTFLQYSMLLVLTGNAAVWTALLFV